MRTTGFVAVLLTLLLALSSCTINLGNTPEDKPAASKTSAAPATTTPPPASTTTPTTTPTPATTAGKAPPTSKASPIKVVSLLSGDKRDPKSGVITHATAVFTPKTPTIFVTAKLKGLNKGAKITAKLIAVSVTASTGAKARNKQLASTTIDSPDTTATAGFHFTPPTKGWPTGAYKVNILVNDQQVRSLSLFVKRST